MSINKQQSCRKEHDYPDHWFLMNNLTLKTTFKHKLLNLPPVETCVIWDTFWDPALHTLYQIHLHLTLIIAAWVLLQWSSACLNSCNADVMWISLSQLSDGGAPFAQSERENQSISSTLWCLQWAEQLQTTVEELPLVDRCGATLSGIILYVWYKLITLHAHGNIWVFSSASWLKLIMAAWCCKH